MFAESFSVWFGSVCVNMLVCKTVYYPLKLYYSNNFFCRFLSVFSAGFLAFWGACWKMYKHKRKLHISCRSPLLSLYEIMKDRAIYQVPATHMLGSSATSSCFVSLILVEVARRDVSLSVMACVLWMILWCKV